MRGILHIEAIAVLTAEKRGCKSVFTINLIMQLGITVKHSCPEILEAAQHGWKGILDGTVLQRQW